MPILTPIYGFKKPIKATELADVDVLNSNMDIAETALEAKIPKSIFTAVNDLIFGASAGVPVKKTLAEAKTILNINNLVYDNPIVTTITTGFASGWSGVITVRKNHNNLVEVSVDLTKNVNISGIETIFTLPVGIRPINTINILLNFGSSSFGSIAGGYGILQISQTGTVGIIPVSGTNLSEARKLTSIQSMYYSA